MSLTRTRPTSSPAARWAHELATVLSAALLCATTGCSKPSAAPAASPQPQSQTAEPAGAGISPQAAQAVGIELAKAGPARITTSLTLYGSVRPNSEREQDIRARYPGVVRSVSKRAGDWVNKGEELLTVESNESLQVYAVRAPLAGRVLDRRTNPGDAVDSSTVLMKVADLSTVWVEFAVFARDLNHVRPGMTVSFRGADREASAEARITYVSPAGEADSQSVIARAVTDNRSGRWVPGQFLTGDVVIGDGQVPVAVASTALQELNGKTVVFVQNEQRFEPRAVQVGRRARDRVEVLEGLADGDLYASRNSYLIKADLLKSETEED
jgi:cobalt-zinc-cadmium efflux system membrane fusion protein